VCFVLLALSPLLSRSCKETQYCSTACQSLHWKLHKTVCRSIAEIKGLAPPRAGRSAPALDLGSSSSPSEEDLRIAWAIAAAAEVGRNVRNGASSSSGDDGDDLLPGLGGSGASPSSDWSFSGLPPNLAAKQLQLTRLCSGAAAPAGGDDVDDGLAAAVGALLDAGCRPDPPEPFGLPLHAAAAAGRADVVDLLLARGADPARASQSGLTPLYLAVLASGAGATTAAQPRAGAASSPSTPSPGNVARALLRAGATVAGASRAVQGLAAATSQLSRGRTLLHLAAAQDTSEDGDLCAALLLDGGSGNGGPEGGAGAGLIDARDDEGNTPLLFAAVHGNMGSVAALLRLGASPGRADDEDSSPMGAAADAAFAAAAAVASATSDEARAKAEVTCARYLEVLRTLHEAGGRIAGLTVPSVALGDLAEEGAGAVAGAGGAAASPPLPLPSSTLLTPFAAATALPALAPLVAMLVADGAPDAAAVATAVNGDGDSTPLHVAALFGAAEAAAALVGAYKRAGRSLPAMDGPAGLLACVEAAAARGGEGAAERAAAVRRALGQ
jgi:ankyrin repeat protein